MKRSVALLAAVLLTAFVAGAAGAATLTVTLAELSGTRVRVEGTGALPNAIVTLDSGAATGPSDGSGAFRIEKDPFASASCVVTVSDGSGSVQATLSGCTPTAPPPPPPGAVPAPNPLAPANGASVVQPFNISWSAVSVAVDYVWEVSPSATFAVVVDRNSATTTQARLSGLVPGTYFWHVKAENASFVSSAFSATSSFTVSGTAVGTPTAPTLTAPVAGFQYHPQESFPVTWTAAANAVSYRVEMARDATFALDTFLISPIVTGTTFYAPLFGFETPLFVRVRGVAADGSFGLPSPTVAGQMTFAAPVPPPPSLLAPANGATVALPIAFDWSDDPNAQLMGYELQVAAEPTFAGDCGFIEVCVRGITPSQYTLGSLSSGTKYWRVRSYHGLAAPGVAAVTAWSAVRSLIVPTTAPSVLSLTIDVWASGGLFIRSHTNVYSGTTADNMAFGNVQLTAPAGAGGTVVTLASSNPLAATLPASITVPAGVATASFRIEPLQVTASTPLTLSASLGAQTVTAPLIVDPPNIKRVDIGAGPPVQNVFSGGATEVGTIVFNGIPPAGSVIALASSSPAVSVPASLTIGPLPPYAFTITTSQVTATTTATITATWKGQAVPISLTLHPPPTLVGPAAGASLPAGQSITFSWNALAGMLSYDIQISNSSTFAAPLLVDLNWSLTQFSSSTLTAGTLFWRVRARDVYGAPGPWSEVRSLTLSTTTVPGPLPAPALSSPAADARFAAGQTVTFAWSAVTGAGSYTLQVGDSSSFTSPLVLSQTVVGATQFSTSGLPVLTMWWRVRANDAAGNPGAWSEIRRFEVK